MDGFDTWLIDNIWALWLGLGVLLVLAEAFAGELYLLMFGIAAGISSALAAMGADWPWTIGSFAIASVALIYFVRPAIVSRMHAGPTLVMGHHGVIGSVGAVTQEITAFDGRILVGDDDWTARSATGETLPIGARVRVVRLDGVTAIVKADAT